MLSLPSLAPQDSYTLWYTASNSASSEFTEPSSPSFDQPNIPQGQNSSPSLHRRNALSRTSLVRLRLDEEYMERRKQNIQNFGSLWIKPPGISKSLHQQREEKREMEEHQEALRREVLAQELAEAEAEGADDLLQGGVEEEMEELRDLDDEVPEADTIAGLDIDDDSENEDEENDSDDVPRGVLTSRMTDDVYREALVRGEQINAPGFGDDGGSTIDEEDASQMLQEEDLIHEPRGEDHDVDMDMNADLDADIPEGEDVGGYEHTDTEEELTSSEEDDSSEDGHGLLRSRRTGASSMVRSDGTQNSMDLSSIMSRSSQIGSSPRAGFDRRRSRQ